MTLPEATTALCYALHDWNAFERAQLGHGDVELGAAVGRAVAFSKTIPAWPAHPAIQVESTDPDLLVATPNLSAHAQMQRTHLLVEARRAWRAWERALAREVPALWPALSMPRLTLHTNRHAGSVSHFRLTFLHTRTNLGKPMLEDEHLPIPVFAGRVCMLLAPLRALPKARGLWALGGPNHTGGSRNTYAIAGPVMAGAGPAEAAVCTAALVRPYDAPFDDRGLVEAWMSQGWVALPSAAAKARAQIQAARLTLATVAGVWNPPTDGLQHQDCP